jgi:hypothetical protein
LEKICRSYASFRFSGGKLSLSCVEQKRSLWWIWKKAWDVLLSKISSSNQFWRDRPNTNCTVHSPTTILSVKLTHVVTQDCWLIKTTFLIHLINAKTLNNWVYRINSPSLWGVYLYAHPNLICAFPIVIFTPYFIFSRKL